MRAPDHLSKRAQAFWKAALEEFDLGVDAQELLLRALEAADRADEAGAILRRDGLIVAGRDGPKPHPAVQIELQNRRAETALLKQLDLAGLDAPSSASQAGKDLARKRYRGR